MSVETTVIENAIQEDYSDDWKISNATLNMLSECMFVFRDYVCNKDGNSDKVWTRQKGVDKAAVWIQNGTIPNTNLHQIEKDNSPIRISEKEIDAVRNTLSKRQVPDDIQYDEDW